MTERDEALSPEEMLALVENQQRSVAGQMGAFVHLILLAWGIAWLVGFLALWLVDAPGPFSLPLAVAAPLFGILLAAAGGISTYLGIRAGRGRRGGKDAEFAGIVYGQSWWLGSLAIFGIGQALVFNGMDSALLGVLYPSAYVFFAGIMYVMAAIIWRATPMLVLGIWSIAISVAAPFAGQPTHYLVFALAGGGGFLLIGLWSWAWLRSARRRVVDGAGE